MSATIQEVAATAEKVVEGIMKVEPIIMTVSSFVPGAAPVMAIVHPVVVAAAPFIEKALENLANGNNGDAFAAFIQLIQHMTAGQPNAPVLSATPAASTTVTGDASQQGSG